MVLTEDFHEIVQDRARRDPEYRACILKEAVGCLLRGEVAVARIVLRDCAIATVGLEQLGALTGRSPEDLRNVLDLEPAPHAGDLLELLACILRHEGLALQVIPAPAEHDAADAAGRTAVESIAAR